MTVRIVPIEPTVKEMSREAEDCEQRGRTEVEPQASVLREKALQLREWIKSLNTGRWTS